MRLGERSQMPLRYMDFVVTGTPRSGTSYMSSLLNALGYDCSHERCFDPWHITFAEERPDDRLWGDSSWLAVPYLGDLPDATKIVHVVRDPVDAINSILGTGQLHWADSDYRRYIAHHWQGDREWWPREFALAAQAFWTEWNLRIESTGRVATRVQLESVIDRVDDLLTVVDSGAGAARPTAAELRRLAPVGINSRPHLDGSPLVEREGLEARTIALARSYGYEY